MTAKFPSIDYEPRSVVNRNGVIFDDEDTQTLFAEDFNAVNEELVAIENYLKNPFSGGAGSIRTVVGEGLSGDCDGLNYIFTPAHTPIGDTYALYCNGLRLVEGGSADYVFDGENFTLSIAPRDNNSRPILDYQYIVT